MQTATSYFDVAQVTLYAFWIFFAGLVLYLRTEDKREGYPLVSERPGTTYEGFPPVPSPKTFLLKDGTVHTAPRGPEREEIAFKGEAVEPWPGAPIQPVGNPLLSGVGPSGYALRSTKPELTWDEDHTRVEPMRIAKDYSFESESPNPIGFEVLGCDGIAAGTVTEAWIDREDCVIRYLEVKTATNTVLVPMPLIRVKEDINKVLLASVTGAQVAQAPVLANPDQVSLREEDQIQAYFASGQLYATATRTDPLL
jgi:photosynthetic reaction center H subunit